MLHPGRHRSRGVMDPIAVAGREEELLGEPAHHGVDVLARRSGRLWGRQIMSPRLMSMSSAKRQGDRLGRKRLGQRLAPGRSGLRRSWR